MSKHKGTVRYMHTFTTSKQTLLVCGSIVILIVAGGTILLTRHHTDKPIHSDNTTSKSLAQLGTTNTNTSTTSVKTTAPNPTTRTPTEADKQAATAANAKPVTEACKLLTLSVAQQILGRGVQTTTPGDTTPQATDTSVTACAYASGANGVQLTVRAPTSSLGISENDTMFGSGRPANASRIQGYGQAAYWDSDRHTLNILGSNNWYVITRSTNTEADAEAVATQLKSGF
jgi:hypothetical protein